MGSRLLADIVAGSEKLAGAVVELVGKADRPVALPDLPELPDAVLAQARRAG